MRRVDPWLVVPFHAHDDLPASDQLSQNNGKYDRYPSHLDKSCIQHRHSDPIFYGVCYQRLEILDLVLLFHGLRPDRAPVLYRDSIHDVVDLPESTSAGAPAGVGRGREIERTSVGWSSE